MKKIYFTLLFLALAMASFSESFYTYTAKNSGLWTTASNWDVILRTDGVKKNKVIIPKYISITADDNVNDLDLGDVEIYVLGSIVIFPGTSLNFSNKTSIELDNGSIVGSSANQKIKIGSDIKYKGNNDGILSGYFRTNSTTGSSPNGFMVFSMLPVNFTSFYISKSSQNIQLSWSTDREINNSHFDVERSFNGLDWQKIAVIFGSGNSNNTNNYSYNDKSTTNPVVYYRLRQVDIDGRAIYSSIKTIRVNETISAVRIYGSEKNVVIDLNTSAKNTLVVSVVNTNGQVISKQSFSNPYYKLNVSLPNATSGAYIVQITDNKGWIEVKKVIL